MPCILLRLAVASAAFSLTAGGILVGGRDGGPGAATAEVFVLSTLYRRHAAVPVYSHDTLRSIIQRIRPDVLVLDVSPAELRQQRVHASKAEYPEVIFPFMRGAAVPAYAGEPDEPLFSQIVTRLSRRLETFREREPEAARADQAYADATFAALEQVWRTPADVNGAVTDQLLASRRRLQDRLAGPEVSEAWSRWNEHAVAMVQRAAREHSGSRVLVLIGVENAALLRPALGSLPGLQVIDMEAWLRPPN